MRTDFFGDKFFVLGHRGFSEKFPENTMVSFEACAANPDIDGVELDVHLCKSGEVVVAHDFSLKRTASIDREIEDITFDELQSIDVGSFKDSSFSGARIPLLEDLFKIFGSRFYYDIELKVKGYCANRELCEKTLALIKKYSMEENVMVSSFNPIALRYFGKICRHSIPTADIFSEDINPGVLRFGFGHNISKSRYLKPHFTEVSESFCKKKKNRDIITWTVNSESDAEKLLDLKEKGFNIRGFIGNNPEILAKTIKKTKK